MLSFTNSFIVLLPPFLKIISNKIFSVLSNFYSLWDFQSTTVTLPFKIRHVVLNPPPHLLRVTSKYLLKTLLFHLERILSETPQLSVLHFLCLPLLLVPLKIQSFHFKWLWRDLGRSLLKFYQPGLGPSRVFHCYQTSRWLKSFSLLKRVFGATPSSFTAETW